MRIAIDVNGKEQIVEFDSMPTDAEIDEVAAQLRAESKPKIMTQGVRTPASTRQPITVRNNTPPVQGFFRTFGSPQLPNDAKPPRKQGTYNPLSPRALAADQARAPYRYDPNNVETLSRSLAENEAARRMGETANRQAFGNAQGPKRVTTSRQMRDDANAMADAVAKATGPAIGAATTGVLGAVAPGAAQAAGDMGGGLLGGILTLPAQLMAEAATLSDEKENRETQLGAAANLALNLVPIEAVVGKTALRKAFQVAARQAARGDSTALTEIVGRLYEMGVRVGDTVTANTPPQVASAIKRAAETVEARTRPSAPIPRDRGVPTAPITTPAERPTMTELPVRQVAEQTPTVPPQVPPVASQAATPPTVPDVPTVAPEVPTKARSANTIFTDEARDEALARMSTIAQRLGRVGSGLDPDELIQFSKDAVVLAGYAVERGVRDSAAWVNEMVSRFGEELRPTFEKAWKDADGIVSSRGSMMGNPRETTSVKNAAAAEIRREMWLDDVPQAERQTVRQTLDEAREMGLTDQARQIAQSILKTPRNLSPKETAALMDRMGQIREQYADILNRSKGLEGDELRNAEQALLNLREEMDELTRATKAAGTEWGRAGVMRQAELDNATDEVTVLARARIAAGRDLTEEETKRFQDLIKQLDETRTKLAEADARLELMTNEGKELADTKQKVQTLQDQLAEAKARAEVAGGDGTTQRLEKQVSELQDQLAEARARAEVYGDDGTTLRLMEKIETLQQQLAEARARVELSGDDGTAFRLKQELDAANKRIAELQEKLAKKKSSTKDDLGKARALDEEVNTLEGQEQKIRDKIKGERQRLEVQNHTTNFQEALLGIRRAGLLGTVRGLARDVVGTALGSGWDTLSMVPAGLLDALAGIWTGNRTTLTANPKAYAEGLKAFWGQGMRDAWEVMRRGATPEDLARQDAQREFNVVGRNGEPVKWLNGYVNFIMRARATPERPFRAMWFARGIAEQAQIIAKSEGFKGAEYKRRVQNLINNPTEAMTINAAARAEEAVFANSNASMEMVSAMKKKSPDKGFVLDFIVPFKQVPSNVAGRIVESSPVGAVGGVVKGLKVGALAREISNPEAQAELVKTLGRASTGTGMIMLGYHLAKEGKVAPTFRTDKSVRDREEVAGRAPSTIEVGGRRYSLTESPLGMLLTIGASIWADENEGKGRSIAQSGLMNVSKAVLDMPLMQGMSDTIKSVQDPINEGARWSASSASSMLPAWLADIAAVMDKDVDRAARTPTEAVMKKVPGLRDDLPEKRDPLGRVKGKMPIINPLDKGQEAEDPIGKEFGRLRIRFQAPNRQNDPKKPLHDPDEATYQNKLKVFGEEVQEQVLRVIQRESYRRLTDEKKTELVTSAVKRGRSIAMEKLKQEEMRAKRNATKGN